eukprot:1177115-Prorocentrum_minimum.AAC.2
MNAESAARGYNVTWTTEDREIPQQHDFKSCGLFTCGNAFQQLKMGHLRDDRGNDQGGVGPGSDPTGNSFDGNTPAREESANGTHEGESRENIKDMV